MSADYNPEIHHRRSIRLKGYDYSQAGAYFLTICTFQRTCLFGEISDGIMKRSDIGKIAEEEWIRTAEVREYVELDAFVVMPNHVHGILVTGDTPEQDTASPCPYKKFGGAVAGSLPTIVGAYKSVVTRRVNKTRGTMGKPVWQDNYYERVLRNEYELDRIREYIEFNPANWGRDKNNPDNRESVVLGR